MLQLHERVIWKELIIMSVFWETTITTSIVDFSEPGCFPLIFELGVQILYDMRLC